MIYLILSITAALGSFYLLKNRKINLANRVFFSFTTLLFLAANCFFLIPYYLTGEVLNESVFFHLQYGLQGAGLSEYSVLIATVAIFLITAASTPFFLLKKIPQSNVPTKSTYLAELLIILSIAISPGVTYTIAHFIPEEPTNDFADYYEPPSISPHDPSSPQKNIVYIYAESFERTYFNEEVFPGLVTHLKELEKHSTTFTDMEQVSMTDWTIAGMVASQCGIPLVSSGNGNSMSGMDTFLQGATCLGDLLESQNYHLQYLGGASLSFAGKGKFYTTHGFDAAGFDEIRPTLEDQEYVSHWGIFDDTLFDLAWEKFQELSAEDQPFGLFTLTLDTHHPNGMPSAICEDHKYQDGSNQILNSVKCSDYQISEFIKKIQSSPEAENTIIVLSSDHLAMKNQAWDLLTSTERRGLFMIIDPSDPTPTQVSHKGSSLDIGPTILHKLGYSSELGLGRNLFESQSLLSKTTKEQFNEKLSHWKSPISEFWAFPVVSQPISIDPTISTITVEERSFKTPSIIEIDPEFQTNIIFEYIDSVVQPTLTTRSETTEKGFIWVDTCSAILELALNSAEKTCIQIQAPNGQVIYSAPLEQKFTVPFETLRTLAGHFSSENQFIPLRVAHAGGGYKAKNYTNSYQALDHSYKNGFSYFELDFQFTSDDHLVCIHDWNSGFRNPPPTLQEFQYWTKYRATENCTLSGLIEWLDKHPKALIITDVKDKNLKALELIAESYPDHINRFIPQIYNPNNFQKVQDLGFSRIIWTLYKYSGTNEDVLENVQTFTGDFAITMPLEDAQTDLAEKLESLNIPTYTHTINDPAQADGYINKQHITNIYTDYLPAL